LLFDLNESKIKKLYGESNIERFEFLDSGKAESKDTYRCGGAMERVLSIVLGVYKNCAKL
jgi:hypothetical protein